MPAKCEIIKVETITTFGTCVIFDFNEILYYSATDLNNHFSFSITCLNFMKSTFYVNSQKVLLGCSLLLFLRKKKVE